MARRKKNSPAWIVANPRRKKRRKNKAKRRRAHAPKAVRRKRRKARRAHAPKAVRRRRRRRKSSAPKIVRRRRRRRRHHAKAGAPMKRRRSRRGRKHSKWGMVKAHRRRTNPGFFAGVLSPIKEHALGFGLGALANRMAIAPLLGNMLAGQPTAQAASKIVIGPVIGALGKKFLPRFSRTWDSLALFFVAIGVDETLGQIMGAGTPTKGLGWAYTTTPGRTGVGGIDRMTYRSIGPTNYLGSIGPTGGAAGLGSLGDTPAASDYQSYSSDGSY